MTYQPLVSTDDLSLTVPLKINANFKAARYLNTSALSASFVAWADDAAGDYKDIYFVTTAAAVITATMPSATSTMALGGRAVTIFKVDAGGGSVTIDGESAETINGAATVSLASQYKYTTMVSNGTNWVIIGSN